MKISWTWKEGLRFAFAYALLSKNDIEINYHMNGAEKFGSLFLKPVYKTLEYISLHMRKPLIIVLFTLLLIFLIFLVFYNIPLFLIFGKIFPSRLVRFLFFLYVESNLLAMGCRTFGRFNNKVLIDLWKKGSLVPVFSRKISVNVK